MDDIKSQIKKIKKDNTGILKMKENIKTDTKS